MNVYVINMDKDKERMDFMSKQLTDEGIVFPRYPAVVGSAVDGNVLRKWHHPLLQWLHNGRVLRIPEIGCAMSHLLLYKRFIEQSDEPCICVLEDDMKVTPYLKKWIVYLDGKVDAEDCSIRLLSTGCDDLSEVFHVEKTKRETCAGAYVITRAAAQRILELNVPIIKPIDIWEYWRTRGGGGVI